jgi:hypothetical protein
MPANYITVGSIVYILSRKGLVGMNVVEIGLWYGPDFWVAF